MAIALMIIGGGWAILGALNILGMFGKTDSGGVLAFGLIFNFLVFVAPGLVLAGIGALLKKRATERAEEMQREANRLRAREADIERRIAQGIQQGIREAGGAPATDGEPSRRHFR